MCFHWAYFTDHPFSSTANDPLAAPGASDGRHTHVVRIVNDEDEATALRCEHANLTIVPGWKRAKSIFSSHLFTHTQKKISNAAASLGFEPHPPADSHH